MFELWRLLRLFSGFLFWEEADRATGGSVPEELERYNKARAHWGLPPLKYTGTMKPSDMGGR